MPKKLDKSNPGALRKEARSIIDEQERSPADSYCLSPAEIDELREHGRQISAQARGKFKHLFEE